MKKLLLVTAVVEFMAGLGLAFAPALQVSLLLGAQLDTPGALSVARMAGAALMSLGLACWFARQDSEGRAAWGIIAGMLIYNLGVVVLLVHARLGLGLNGIVLWPAVGLHTLMAAWCVAGLRNRPA